MTDLQSTILNAVLVLVSGGASTWAGYQFLLWRKELDFACSGEQKHRVAVHEAGHAICVIKCDYTIRSSLNKVSTVPDEKYGGYCSYRYQGDGVVAAWEHLVVSMAGPAGELVARETVDAVGSRGDLTYALELANKIAHAAPGAVAQFDEAPYLELLSLWYPDPLAIPVRNTISMALWTAIDRISKNERAFYRLADALVDRRELTGNQIGKLLEGL